MSLNRVRRRRPGGRRASCVHELVQRSLAGIMIRIAPSTIRRLSAPTALCALWACSSSDTTTTPTGPVVVQVVAVLADRNPPTRGRGDGARRLQQRRNDRHSGRERRELHRHRAVPRRSRAGRVRHVPSHGRDGRLGVSVSGAESLPLDAHLGSDVAGRTYAASDVAKGTGQRAATLLRRAARARSSEARVAGMARVRRGRACRAFAVALGRHRSATDPRQHSQLPCTGVERQLVHVGRGQARVHRHERSRLRRHAGAGERVQLHTAPDVRRLLRPDALSDRYGRVRRAKRRGSERPRHHADDAGGERARLRVVVPDPGLRRRLLRRRGPWRRRGRSELEPGRDLLLDGPGSRRESRAARTASTRSGFAVPGTFLHELQHLISFSQHVVVHHSNPEYGWLDEGLSIVAEELGSLYYEQKCPGTACRTRPDADSSPIRRRGSSRIFCTTRISTRSCPTPRA